MRLGVGVTDASRRNPAVTAQAAATLPVMSGFRVGLGNAIVVSADQLDGFIQSFLPPTRDENVSSFVNEQLGTGQRHIA